MGLREGDLRVGRGLIRHFGTRGPNGTPYSAKLSMKHGLKPNLYPVILSKLRFFAASIAPQIDVCNVDSGPWLLQELHLRRQRSPKG